MSTKKKIIILAVILLLVLGVAGACAVSASEEPAQSPGIELDVDHKKKSKKKSSSSSSRRK